MGIGFCNNTHFLYLLKIIKIIMRFKKYRRKQNVEMRKITHVECRGFPSKTKGIFMKPILIADGVEVSISKEDRKNGSPKLGDMIARDPLNHNDQWLVSEEYFKNNFE